jgi:hypothetical protein
MQSRKSDQEDPLPPTPYDVYSPNLPTHIIKLKDSHPHKTHNAQTSMNLPTQSKP